MVDCNDRYTSDFRGNPGTVMPGRDMSKCCVKCAYASGEGSRRSNLGPSFAIKDVKMVPVATNLLDTQHYKATTGKYM